MERMLKTMVRRALYRRGWERTGKPNILTYLETHKVDLVLDVGANTGQFGNSLRECGYRGRIWSFEPIDTVFRDLEKLTRFDGRWQATCTAVGAVAGEATLNVSERSDFSSIKPINETGREFDARIAVVRKQQVPVATLEYLLKNEESRHMFLKVDTQGFEREVLEGALNLLPKLVGIQLEVPIENLYGNVWSFPVCIKYMDDIGYVPAQFEVVNAMKHDPASAVEFDCIFRPKVTGNDAKFQVSPPGAGLE